MTQNPVFILAGNGAYENRGCEAIVRGTVKILRHYFEDPSFLCISHFNSDDQYKKQCNQEFDKSIIHKKTNRPQTKCDINWWMMRFVSAINPRSNIYHHMYKEMLPYIGDSKAVLSIGGDNYSLDYGVPKLFTELDDIALKKEKPLIIWGASVGPFDKIPKYEKYMMDHLQKVTAIFARESATIEYLTRNNLCKNLYSISDPAFLLDPIKPSKEINIDIDEGAIGLNFSPLMAKYVTEGDIQEWAKVAAKTVELISKKTSRKIYLIPHVTVPNSNDYIFMKEILKHINNRRDQIVLIPPKYNASETKWIISKMAIFAGARTHSTIASLSSCVPTLSFAYSIKAIGINKDIFGHDLYCINPRDLNPEKVLEKIEYMLEKNKEIRNHLHHKIPMVQKEALMAGKHLYEILEG